jgi:hypothetical protein
MTTREGLHTPIAATGGMRLVAAAVVLVVIAAGVVRWSGSEQTPAPVSQEATFVVPGIELPDGMRMVNLPRGLTDYVRYEAQTAPGAFVAPGIEMPAGMGTANLPRGLTDYVRH